MAHECVKFLKQFSRVLSAEQTFGEMLIHEPHKATLAFQFSLAGFFLKDWTSGKKKKKTLLHQKASEKACYSICFISSQGSKTAFSRGIILKYYCIHQVKMMSQRKLSLTRSLFDSLFDKPTFLGQRGLNMLNSSIFPCSSVAMSRIFWHWVVCAQMIG